MTTETTKPTPRKQYGAGKGKGKASLPPMTLEQLRSYLKGIQFVGGEGWHPDQKQWEAIVYVIDTLVPDQPVVNTPQYPQYPQYDPQQQPVEWSAPPQPVRDGWGNGVTMVPPTPSTPEDGAPYRTEFL